MDSAGKYVVLKIGGSLKEESLKAVVAAVREAMADGLRPLVVHGGGPRITKALAEQNIVTPFVDGERVTTDDAMEVVERVLAREVNQEIVAQLCAHGIPAVGMSGAEGLIMARPLLGRARTGRVAEVNAAKLVNADLGSNVVVVAPIGSDASGLTYNINADLAAAAIAGSLQASRMVFLTDVPGIFSDFGSGTLLTDVSAHTLEQMTREGRFDGGMIPKVSAVLAASTAGVPWTFVVDGRDEDAVAWAVKARVSNAVETRTVMVARGATVGRGTLITV